MLLSFKIFFFLCSISTSFMKVQCEDFEDDADIPVIVGDGGVVRTGVENDVLILTKDNFDIQVMSKDIILVEFYAPWCGHCKSLEPEYAKAAKILKDQDIPVSLAKVDATIESDLAKQYDVSGFPTLYIFKKGQKTLYDGPRTAMGIVEYMNQRADPNWKPPPEEVITLTTENFSTVVDNAEIILVEFYAPWCGHCKQLAPEYERAAKALKSLPKPILLAKVDATIEKDLAHQYEATGYPTLLIFRKGVKYQYEGPRDEAGIVSYMKEQAKPPTKEMSSIKQLKNAIGKIDATIVGFFKSDDDELYKNFIESANTLRGKFTFLHTFDKDVKKQFGYNKPEIVLYHPEIYTTEYESSKYELKNTAASIEGITKFIQENSLPLVGEKSQRNYWQFENKYPLVVVYYDVDFSFDHRIQTQLVRKEVAIVAKDYKGKITFVVANENAHEEDLKNLNLADSGEDVNVGYYETQKVRYRMDPAEDFSAEDLKEFVRDVLAGNLPRHIKSQPLPKSNKSLVLTVVGSTFEEVVTKNSKDVFIEFYAPWCGHCKKLDPIYNKLGKAFADSDKVVIAKIDATANDYPSEFDVKGFPTLIYVPGSSKKDLKTYNGAREFKEMSEFVNQQLTDTKDEL